MKKNRQFLGGAIISYCTIIFQILTGLFYTPWMIKTIGNDHYALYTLATSIITIFMMDFGIGGSVSKFLSNFYAKKEYKKANEFLGIIYEIFIIISILVGFGLFLFYIFIEKIYSNLSVYDLQIFKHLFVIVSTYSVILFPFSTFNAILNANEQFVWLKICAFLQNVLNVLLILICLYFEFGVYSLVIVHGITNFISMIIKYIIIRKNTEVKAVFFSSSKGMVKDLLNFSFFTTINSFAQRCIFNILPSVISILLNSKAVTIFSIAITLESYVYMFTQAINGMFLPSVSRINNSSTKESQLNFLMCKVGKFHIYTLGLLYLGFLLIGKSFIKLWMGVDYLAIYPCALLIIFPSLLDTPQQVARTALLVNDILKEQTYIYVGMAIINILCSIVFINMFGIIGAALSVCLAYLFRTISFNFLYYFKLKINIKAYFISTYFKWSFSAFFTYLACVAVFQLFTSSGWHGFIIKGIIVVIVYIIFCSVFNWIDIKNFIEK